jgi:hypothetical protein
MRSLSSPGSGSASPGISDFTDTVAGAAVGLGTVCALALLLDFIRGTLTASRALPHEPASRPEEGIDNGRIKR